RLARPAPRGSLWSAPWLQAAAVLLVLAAGFLLFGRLGGGGAPVAAAQRHTTGVGEVASVALPDGSRVLLGPASELVVAGGYGAADRGVELRGEAYFEVDHDEARPFRVRVGDALVTDLGTVFTIR